MKIIDRIVGDMKMAEQIHVRFLADDARVVRAAARVCGVTVSEFIRTAAVARAKVTRPAQ